MEHTIKNKFPDFFPWEFFSGGVNITCFLHPVIGYRFEFDKTGKLKYEN